MENDLSYWHYMCVCVWCMAVYGEVYTCRQQCWISETIEWLHMQYTMHTSPHSLPRFPPSVFLSLRHLPMLKVTREEAEAWCKSNGIILYFETSAKNSTNLIDTFQGVARAIVKLKLTMEESSLQNPTHRGMLLKQNTEPTTRSDASGCSC